MFELYTYTGGVIGEYGQVPILAVWINSTLLFTFTNN